MEEAGFVRREVGTSDARQRSVHLTERGAALLAEVEGIYAEIEHEWASVIGSARVHQLRHDLATVLTHANDGRLPPVRPTW